MIAVMASLATGCTSMKPGPRADSSAMWCGPPLNAAGGWWKCTFADDFDGSTLDRGTWTPLTFHGSGDPPSKACHVDNPRNVAVQAGRLRLTVRRPVTPVVCDGVRARYTSGTVTTYRKFSQKYGRFAARVKVQPTTAPGLKEAFWLWPDDRVRSNAAWPAAGEIDIFETYSRYPTLAIPFLHYTANDNGGPRPGINTAWDCPARRGVFNTYVLTWTPTTIRIDINGRTCLTNNAGDPAFQKPYIMAFSSAVGVDANAPTPNTLIPASMSVDWVRVWSWMPPAPVS